MADINLFQILGHDIVNAMTSEERRQIDAISTRLSKDDGFGELYERRQSFINSRVEALKKQAEESQNYQKELEAGFK